MWKGRKGGRGGEGRGGEGRGEEVLRWSTTLVCCSVHNFLTFSTSEAIPNRFLYLSGRKFLQLRNESSALSHPHAHSYVSHTATVHAQYNILLYSPCRCKSLAVIIILFKAHGMPHECGNARFHKSPGKDVHVMVTYS